MFKCQGYTLQRIIQAVNDFLTHPHADAGSAEGNDAGDLQRPAALRAHQAVPRLQAAFGTATPRASALRLLVSLWLGLPRLRVLFIPLLALALSHDAPLRESERSRWNVLICREDGSKLRGEGQECDISHVHNTFRFIYLFFVLIGASGRLQMFVGQQQK